MQKMILSAVILSFLFLPMLSGCESKQLKDENAKLKQQVDMLNKDKMATQVQSSQMTAQMDELRKKNADLGKENADLKAKVAELQKMVKKPAKKPVKKSAAKPASKKKK
jgi:peptidoglycan hydrolase CwlO-like protein